MSDWTDEVGCKVGSTTTALCEGPPGSDPPPAPPGARVTLTPASQTVTDGDDAYFDIRWDDDSKAPGALERMVFKSDRDFHQGGPMFVANHSTVTRYMSPNDGTGMYDVWVSVGPIGGPFLLSNHVSLEVVSP